MADDGVAGRRRLGDRHAYQLNQTAPNSFPPYWTRPDVKGLLFAMQGRTCAYCGIVTHGLDLEHFRPKGAIEGDANHGGYWWLAYECSNYLLVCTVCNRSRKKTRFPIIPGTIRCTFDTRDTIVDEKRVLLDPAEDPVEDWLTIDSEAITARLIPNPVLGAAAQLRVQEAIDLFGLNIDPEVRRQRSKTYEEAARAAMEQRWDDLRKSAMRHRPHSLAARIVLQRTAPQFLPSAEEEMKELFDLLWGDLIMVIDEIRGLKARGKTPSPLDEGQVNALIWALAILRSDPPGGDPAIADSYLEELLRRETADNKTNIIKLFSRYQESTQP